MTIDGWLPALLRKGLTFAADDHSSAADGRHGGIIPVNAHTGIGTVLHVTTSSYRRDLPSTSRS